MLVAKLIGVGTAHGISHEGRQGAAELAWALALTWQQKAKAGGARAGAAAHGGAAGRGPRAPAAHVRAVEAVVARLLMAACADTSLSVRRTVLRSMQAASPLDTYLAQADWCALG